MHAYRPTLALALPLAANLLLTAPAQAGTVATRTEDQTLVWDDATTLPQGASFGAKLDLVDTPAGGSIALISAPQAGAMQRFELAPGASLWSAGDNVHSLSTQHFPVAVDFYPLYAVLDPGGATTSIRRADTDETLVPGIDGGWVWSLVMNGTTLAIGQPSYFGNSGRVRIYEQQGAGNWVHAKTFVGPFDSGLGTGLAIDGPVVVAGAPAAGDNGAVFVYARTSSWFELQRIDSPASGQTDALFGWEVALDGDLLAIGSPSLDRVTPPPALSDAGGVYVYEVVTPPFLEFEIQALLRPPGVTDFDRFGTSVDIVGLVSGGVELVAGSPGEDDGALDAGAVYRYLRTREPDATAWSLVGRMARSAPRDIDQLGSTVRLGRSGVLAGAPYHVGPPEPLTTGMVLFFDSQIFADGFESGDTSAWTSVEP